MPHDKTQDSEADGLCWETSPRGLTGKCAKPSGHYGLHQNTNGQQWPTDIMAALETSLATAKVNRTKRHLPAVNPHNGMYVSRGADGWNAHWPNDFADSNDEITQYTVNPSPYGTRDQIEAWIDGYQWGASNER